MKNSALVVIDLQNDLTKNYKEIIAKVNEAIDWAEQKGLWIVCIQQKGEKKRCTLIKYLLSGLLHCGRSLE